MNSSKYILLVCTIILMLNKSSSAFLINNVATNIPASEYLKLPSCTMKSLQVRGGGSINTIREKTSLLMQINPGAASLLAGSLAGAIGVGIAFPLDTLKTKSQVLSQEAARIRTNPSDLTATAIPLGSTDVSQMNMFQLIALIYSLEGFGGFFGGIRGMMVGQALIKAVAFATNAFVLDYLRTNWASISSTPTLLLAACTAGFVTSFLVTPIERIKVMMQASKKYNNEFSCLRAIVDIEGWGGLLNRGLGTTLAREIPSYGLYFFLYGFLSQLPIAASLGMAAPLIFGALSGMASWLPVYPIDVVKTLVQNTDGSTSISAVEIAKELYLERGIGGFFDGITPKMLRAAVNHAVTFYCYDIVMNMIAAL